MTAPAPSSPLPSPPVLVPSLALLRQRLAEAVAPPVAAGDTVATGIVALDGVLPGGGVPCGRLTELVGAPGSGRTTLVRALAANAIAAGRWVAYVDGARTLAPSDWAPLAATNRLWIVRPPREDQATWCADVLLRSGAFGVVVLDSAPAVSRQVAVRLTRLAREANAALVALRDDADRALTGGAVRIRFNRRLEPVGERPARPPSPMHWRSVGSRLALAADGRARPATRHAASAGPAKSDEGPSLARQAAVITMTLEKGGGGPAVVEVSCATDRPRRLRADSAIPDRRGVAKRNRRGELAAPDAPGVRRPAVVAAGRGGAGEGAGGATLPRKRRCAEPEVRRDEFLLSRPSRETCAAARLPPVATPEARSGSGEDSGRDGPATRQPGRRRGPANTGGEDSVARSGQSPGWSPGQTRGTRGTVQKPPARPAGSRIREAIRS